MLLWSSDTPTVHKIPGVVGIRTACLDTCLDLFWYAAVAGYALVQNSGDHSYRAQYEYGGNLLWFAFRTLRVVRMAQIADVIRE